MNPISSWLHQFLGKGEALPEGIDEENFFAAGILDSFDAILLVEAIEAEYGFRFSEKHFQDPRFVTIAGLTDIIEELGRN